MQLRWRNPPRTPVLPCSASWQVSEALDCSMGITVTCCTYIGHIFTLQMHFTTKLRQAHCIVTIEFSLAQIARYLSEGKMQQKICKQLTSLPFRAFRCIYEYCICVAYRPLAFCWHVENVCKQHQVTNLVLPFKVFMKQF